MSKIFPRIRALPLAVLLVSNSLFPVLGNSLTLAQKSGQKRVSQNKPKIAPDLAEILRQDDEEETAQLRGKTLAEVRQERLQRRAARANQPDNNEEETMIRRVNGSVLPSPLVLAEERQSFILQTTFAKPGVVLGDKINRLGGRIQQQFDNTGLLVIEAPRTVIRQIAADPAVAYVSPDRAVSAMGHIETTTGAAQIRKLISGITLDGTGIGIAVLDSGMDKSHHLFHGGVAEEQDFTGQGSVVDSYGHGTHVGSMAIGDPGLASGAYTGVAQGAKVFNLRVLDRNGLGSASSIINAINWCITNKTTKKIPGANGFCGCSLKR